MSDFVCPVCGKTAPPTCGLIDPVELLMVHLNQHTGEELRGLVAAVRRYLHDVQPGDMGGLVEVVRDMRSRLKNIDALDEARDHVVMTGQEPRGEG